MTRKKYGPKGERRSGRILAHNHIRHTVGMPHGWNGFRRWYDYLDPERQGSRRPYRVSYVRCRCGWRPDLGVHYRVKGKGTDDYRCDSVETVLEQ